MSVYNECPLSLT